MTMRSIEAKYEFFEEVAEALQECGHETVADMMNNIEDVLEGHEYQDVYFALATLLVSAMKEENADPEYVYAAVNMHVSAAWRMLMGNEEVTMN